MARHWLTRAAALLLLAHGAAADSVVSDCGNGGKVTLVKGEKSTEAIVYGASCNVTTLTVDAKSKLSASGLKIQVVQSIPDVVELNLALNAISAWPKLEDADALTKLCVRARLSRLVGRTYSDSHQRALCACVAAGRSRRTSSRRSRTSACRRVSKHCAY